MKIFVKTLGCRANRYESEKLMDQLIQNGHSFVANSKESNCVIVNTCTVTHVADRKSRQEIYPHTDKTVIVFGCGPRTDKESYQLDGVDFVATEPSEVLDFLGEDSDGGADDVFLTRANLKIQDGCENYCTYCIIPFARGKCTSKPLDELLAETDKMVANGVKEVVLTGINIGKWVDGEMDFWDLMKLLLDKYDIRIRISSVEPFDFEEKVKTVLTHPNFCRHLHICAQSGCDTVLTRMGRQYKTEKFKSLIAKIREFVPEIAITTDIIVGFPGETNEEHKETLAFIKRVNFAKVHTFKYSKRKGTPAAKAAGQIPYDVKVARSKNVRNLEAELRNEYLENFVGKTMPVLFEQEKNGVWLGTTDNYMQVGLKSGKDLRNQVVPVRLGAITRGRFKGRVVSGQ